MRRRLASVAVVALAVALAACGDETEEAGSNPVAITATDTTCQVQPTEFPAGNTRIAVTNRGSEMTGVYVYARGDDVVTERHVEAGTSASFTANLDAGEYEIACKPGDRGAGIRQRITVR